MLGILDSTLVFFLPLGIDAVVIFLAASNPSRAWLYAALAATGGVVGSAITYWVGRKIGEHGLSRFVSASRLASIRARLRRHGAFTVAALALVPPPFPFTPFVLMAGALHFSRFRLFPLLGLARFARFAVEVALAVHYGDALTEWMASDTFRVAVGAFVIVAMAGTIGSIVWVVRRSHRA